MFFLVRGQLSTIRGMSFTLTMGFSVIHALKVTGGIPSEEVAIASSPDLGILSIAPYHV